MILAVRWALAKLLLPIPQRFVQYVYLFFYWIFKIKLQFKVSKKHFVCWPRNSLSQGRTVLFASDIDITFLAKDDLDFEGKRLAVRALRTPMLGEINFYRQSDLPKVAELINPCELQRDINLKNLIASVGAEPRPMDAISKSVFLWKMLEADADNLQHRANMRVRKWQGHLEDLEIQDFRSLVSGMRLNRNPTFEITGVIANLLHLEGHQFARFYKEIQLWQSTSKDHESLKLVYRSPYDYPWTFAFAVNHLCMFRTDLPVFSRQQIDCIFEVYRWEQFAKISQGSQLNEHINNLKDCAKILVRHDERFSGLPGILDL